MTKYVKAYLAFIKSFLADEAKSASDERFKEVMDELQMKIAYFQHERFIHLLVTVLFALSEMIMIAVDLIIPSVSSVLLSAMLLILLIPYIFHYYFLENSVQELYKIRDSLIEIRRSNLHKA